MSIARNSSQIDSLTTRVTILEKDGAVTATRYTEILNRLDKMEDKMDRMLRKI